MPCMPIVISNQDFIDYIKTLSYYKILGIDYGEKKMGFAESSNNLKIALPAKIETKTIQSIVNSRQSDNPNIDVLNQYDAIVIGYPLELNGKPGMRANVVTNFTNSLAIHYQKPITLIDERFTTSFAKTYLKDMGINKKQRDKLDDIGAAMNILETILARL